MNIGGVFGDEISNWVVVRMREFSKIVTVGAGQVTPLVGALS